MDEVMISLKNSIIKINLKVFVNFKVIQLCIDYNIEHFELNIYTYTHDTLRLVALCGAVRYITFMCNAVQTVWCSAVQSSIFSAVQTGKGVQ